MTLWLLAGLSVGCYFFKVGGVLVADTSRLSLWGEKFLSCLTPAVLSGLIIVQTFDVGRELAIGALTAGVAAGAGASWLKAPLPAVLAIAATTTAVIRLL
jgi:uncharacterized membrane protein